MFPPVPGHRRPWRALVLQSLRRAPVYRSDATAVAPLRCAGGNLFAVEEESKQQEKDNQSQYRSFCHCEFILRFVITTLTVDGEGRPARAGARP